jgi:hypothetical protein
MIEVISQRCYTTIAKLDIILAVVERRAIALYSDLYLLS